MIEVDDPDRFLENRGLNSKDKGCLQLDDGFRVKAKESMVDAWVHGHRNVREGGRER